MNISLSNVSYCADWSDPGCPDDDNDGVCNIDDVCPGFDDNLDTDGDGTSDGCDPCPLDFSDDSDGDGVCDSDDICPGGDDTVDSDGDGTPDDCEVDSCQSNVTSQFPVNPLIHSGTGSSSSTILSINGHTDVSFSISNIGQKTNGKPSTRYIERVVVTYIDGSGGNQTYGTFAGTGTANIDISGPVQSITVELDDAYGGSTGSVSLSVNMSAVDSCADSSPSPAANEQLIGQAIERFKLYPNPAKNKVNLKLEQNVLELKITVYDVVGKKLKTFNVSDKRFIELDVSDLSGGNIYFISLEIPGRTPEIHKLILID